MIFDKKLEFCNETDVNAGSLNDVVVLTDLIDLNDDSLELGVGEIAFVGIIWTEDLAGSTAISFQLQECDTEGGTYTDVLGCAASILLADAVKGKVMKIAIPNLADKFVRLEATNTGTGTAGKVTAGIVL